jgi:asparagine synthase (glutamine-hydrolysing)
MCGIAGLVYRDASRRCSAEVVEAMRDIASYRGPDDSGIYLDGPAGLGHRRLSIIDLGGGHQPMTDEHQRFWIVYNGEVYNFRETRQQLEAKGHVFRTNCDTEVILRLYIDRGERCVEALNGMFAFAIWDAQERTLFLARDRMGVKPLYYAETPEAFVFGSEIKSCCGPATSTTRFCPWSSRSKKSASTASSCRCLRPTIRSSPRSASGSTISAWRERQ